MSIPGESSNFTGGDESDDFQWPDFDSEVNELFDESHVDIQRETLITIRTGEIVSELFQLLDGYDVPNRLIDPSQDRELELFQEYATPIHDIKIDELGFSPDGIRPWDFTRITLECIMQYNDERDSQLLLFNSAVGLRITDEFPDLLPLIECTSIDEVKGELLAIFQIHHKLDYRWLQFFRDVTPGQDHVFHTPSDDMQVEKADRSLAQFENDRAIKWRIIEKARKIMGIDDESDKPDDVVSATIKLIDLQRIASREVQSYNDSADRDMDLWILGRNNMRIDEEIMRRLSQFFKMTYRFEDS